MDHIGQLLKSLYVMASSVKARGRYTGGHLWRVAQFRRPLATEFGLPDTDLARALSGRKPQGRPTCAQITTMRR
jgi:HD-GYP domain-containing protein (c-di-GMP phosphodiesterase class II)